MLNQKPQWKLYSSMLTFILVFILIAKITQSIKHCSDILETQSLNVTHR